MDDNIMNMHSDAESVTIRRVEQGKLGLMERTLDIPVGTFSSTGLKLTLLPKVFLSSGYTDCPSG